MKKKILIISIIIVLLILLIPVPIRLKDGGTVEYIGIGYKVIDFHAIIYNPYKGIMEYKYERIHMCPWWMAYDELLDKYVYNSY